MQYTIIKNNKKYKKKKKKDTRLLKSLKKMEKKNISYINRSGGILKEIMSRFFFKKKIIRRKWKLEAIYKYSSLNNG